MTKISFDRRENRHIDLDDKKSTTIEPLEETGRTMKIQRLDSKQSFLFFEHFEWFCLIKQWNQQEETERALEWPVQRASGS